MSTVNYSLKHKGVRLIDAQEAWIVGKKNMAVQLISAEKSMGEKVKPVRADFSHLESLQQQNEGGTYLSPEELEEVCTDLTVYKETEDFVILRREV